MFILHNSHISYTYTDFSSGEHNSVDSTLKVIQEVLYDHYQNVIGWLQPLAWNESFRIHIKHIYTNLEMITQTQEGLVTKTEPLASYSDIFQGRTGHPIPRRILIEGKAGVGKSTFVSELAYDWACQSTNLEQFKLVLLIELKQTKGSTLKEAIFAQLFPRDFCFSAEKLFQYISAHQEGVLFILDGYDEINPSELRDVQDLITGKILRNGTVLVTSRPGKGSRIHWFMDLRIKITGFNTEDMHEFVLKYFQDNPESAKSLIAELEMHPVAQDIARIPLTAVLLCAMWEEMPHTSLLCTVTGLFSELTVSLVKRFYARNPCGVSRDAEDIFSLEDIPQGLLHSLLLLGEISLNGLLKDKLIFDLREVEKRCGRDVLDLGFLSRETSSSRLKPIKKCRFVHRSYQEFLAALWLSNQIKQAFADESVFETVSAYVLQCLAAELNTVLFWYTPGLLAQSFEPFFELLLSEGNLHVQDDATVKQSFLEVCIISLFESCQGRLAHLLSPQVPEGVLRLQEFQGTPYKIRALAYFLQNNPTVRSLIIIESRLDKQTLAVLARLLPGILPLKELHLIRNIIEDGGMKSFSESLQGKTNLEMVVLHANTIGTKSLKHVTYFLKCCPRLAHLDFSERDFGVKEMRHMMTTLQGLPLMKHLDPNTVLLNVGSDGIPHLQI